MRYYFGWNVVAATFLFQSVISGLSTFCFTLWVTPWIDEFGASRSEIMAASTASILVSGLLSPVVGSAMDRYSIRGLACAGALLFATAFALISQVTAVWEVVLIYATLVGLAVAMAGPMVGMIIAAKWFRARRGLAIGIVATGIAAGGVFLPPIVTAALAVFGWRKTDLLLSLLVILLVPIIWLVIRNSPVEQGGEPESEGSSALAARTTAETRTWRTGEILRDRGFLIIAVVFMPPTIAIYGILQNLGPLARDNHYSAAALSAFLSTFGMMMLIGKLLFGGLADRTDARYLYWLAIAALAAAIAIILGSPSSFRIMLLASALIGFAGGSYMPLMGAAIGSRFGSKSFGQAMGLLYPSITLSSIGPLLTGWMRDEFGSYDGALWVYLISLVPVALLMTAFPVQPNESSPRVAGLA
jgi:OFA family oxalate/formate antiporter-like MFS transporter